MDNDIKEYTTPKGEKRYKFLIYVGKDETTGHTIQIKKQGFKSKDEALEAYLNYKLKIVKDTMHRYDENWLINIISLKENKSYIVCSDEEVTDNLIKMFNMPSTNNIVVLQPSIFRKEIIKTALEMSKNVSHRK